MCWCAVPRRCWRWIVLWSSRRRRRWCWCDGRASRGYGRSRRRGWGRARRTGWRWRRHPSQYAMTRSATRSRCDTRRPRSVGGERENHQSAKPLILVRESFIVMFVTNSKLWTDFIHIQLDRGGWGCLQIFLHERNEQMSTFDGLSPNDFRRPLHMQITKQVRQLIEVWEGQKEAWVTPNAWHRLGSIEKVEIRDLMNEGTRCELSVCQCILKQSGNTSSSTCPFSHQKNKYLLWEYPSMVPLMCCVLWNEVQNAACLHVCKWFLRTELNFSQGPVPWYPWCAQACVSLSNVDVCVTTKQRNIMHSTRVRHPPYTVAEKSFLASELDSFASISCLLFVCMKQKVFEFVLTESSFQSWKLSKNCAKCSEWNMQKACGTFQRFLNVFFYPIRWTHNACLRS